MTLLHTEYQLILVFFTVGTILSLVLFGVSYLLAVHIGDSEKLAAYECGFDPFDDARSAFDVRFYLVAILFIIFDLEIAYLFPWVTVVSRLSSFGF